MLLSEYGLEPNAVLDGWTDEQFALMLDKFCERKEREKEAYEEVEKRSLEGEPARGGMRVGNPYPGAKPWEIPGGGVKRKVMGGQKKSN